MTFAEVVKPVNCYEKILGDVYIRKPISQRQHWSVNLVCCCQISIEETKSNLSEAKANVDMWKDDGVNEKEIAYTDLWRCWNFR